MRYLSAPLCGLFLGSMAMAALAAPPPTSPDKTVAPSDNTHCPPAVHAARPGHTHAPHAATASHPHRAAHPHPRATPKAEREAPCR